LEEEGITTVNVTQRLRPLRLAFLIERDDRRQALEAIRVCNRIWGGALCPIIPVYRRKPSWVAQERADLTNGWIAAFEPDALVEVAPGTASRTGYEDHLVVPLSEVEQEHGLRSVATTVWQAYATAYDEVYQFAQRHPEDTVLCDPATRADALWVAAFFGSLPMDSALRKAYVHTFDPVSLEIGEKTFMDLVFRRPPTTPLAATLWGLKLSRSVKWRAIYYIFDPGSVIDVLHMWSLRAYGLMLYPVPLPYLGAFRVRLKREVQEGYDRGPVGDHPMTISPAPSITPAMVQTSIDALTDLAANHVLLDPVPGRLFPFWNAEALAEKRIARLQVTASETEGEVTMKDHYITLVSPEAPFRGNPPVSRPNAWASSVTVREPIRESELAEVFPPDLRDVTDLLQRFGPRDPVTATTEGLTARFDEFRNQQWWKMPTGPELFIDWLQTRGVEATVSGAGKTTEEFIRTLGNPHRAIQVGAPALVKLLGRAAAAPGGGVFSFQELQQVLGRLHQGNKERMRGHTAALTANGVIQPQVSARCTWCSQLNWYGPAELDSSLQCRRCRRSFAFPASPPPSSNNWGYRPVGSFATPDYAHGAYSVALAIRFFLHFGFLSGGQSWTTSLEGRKNGRVFEIDFGLWLKWGLGDEVRPHLIFGEAKTFNHFEKIDFRRAEQLLRDFPEATMAFATLRSELTATEQTAIAQLAAKGKGNPYRGRVIVLTEAELTDQDTISVTFAWKKRGGRAEQVAEAYGHVNDLPTLSDATLDLYADFRWPSDRR
jgi:hypothetical protein